MAVLSGREYARDLASAKNTLVARTRRYANEIIPGVPIRILFASDIPHHMEAFAEIDDAGNLYCTYNELLVEANIYNLDSEAVMSVIPHELCHSLLMHRWDKPERGKIHRHSTKEYVDCVTKYTKRLYAKSMIHWRRYTFTAYYGSRDRLVPIDIFFIYRYFCPVCNKVYFENRIVQTGEPKTCGVCGGSIDRLKHLMPSEVYREVVDYPHLDDEILS